MPVVKQIAVPQIQTIEKIVEIPMVQAGCRGRRKGDLHCRLPVIMRARWWKKWWKFLKWDQLLRARCEKSTYRERPSEKRIPPKWCNRRSIDLLSSLLMSLWVFKGSICQFQAASPGRCLLAPHIRWSMSQKMLRLRRSQSKVQHDGCWTEARV